MAAANIPLLCSICPKRPNFSDVSHLLTHISSKGHLSNYYKVRVRSSTEDASRRLVDAYDRWYTEWNVEELVSERMNQKDKRRSRARPPVRATPAPRIAAPVPRSARARAAVGNLLDPRLSEQQMIKVEHGIAPTPTPQPGPVLHRRGFAPHMQYWQTESRASSRSYTNPDYETSSEYSDPSQRRRYRATIENSCAIEDDFAEAATADPMAVSESTKLKGVYWPGMDIFDSATPEMRRKRNQKKDSSVVEQLELNSQYVEATELIFTPQGSFKRQRRISSSVYDDEEESPVKAESPKQVLVRPVLANMDVNTRRRSRQLARPQTFQHLSRNLYDDNRSRSDLEYGYGDWAPKRKRAFDIFQDEEVSFAQPAAFNYLTAGLHQQPSPTLAPTLPSYKTFNNPFHIENKENILPALHPSSYEQHHHQQPAGYHYHGYVYGLGPDQPAFPLHNHMYTNSGYHQQELEDDDQRTITAPPSPATS